MDPMTPVIVAGSGPSLDAESCHERGWPICAVSTAIRFIRSPRYWILVDNVNHHHQLQKGDQGIGGAAALSDPSVEIVVPSTRLRSFRDATNVTVCPRLHAKDTAARRRSGRGEPTTGPAFLDEGQYCIRTFNRSMLFAVEWLMKFGGYRTLIFVGCDLLQKPGQKYDAQLLKKINSVNHNHMREFQVWKQWAPLAQAKGYRWLCWTPGSILETIMEKYDGAERFPDRDGGDDRQAAGVRSEEPAAEPEQLVEVEPPAAADGGVAPEVPGAEGESPHEQRPDQGGLKVRRQPGLSAEQIRPFFQELFRNVGDRACTLPNHHHRVNAELKDAQRKFIFRTCRVPRRTAVLDYGCGAAELADMFQGRYVGADVTPALIQRARRLNPRKTFVLLDEPWLPENFGHHFRMFFTCTVFQNNNDDQVRHVLHSLAACQSRAPELELWLYEMSTRRDQTSYVAGRDHDDYHRLVLEFFNVLHHSFKSHRPREAEHQLHHFRVVG